MQNPINPKMMALNQPGTKVSGAQANTFQPGAGSSGQTAKIAALEQRVTQLEAMVQQLASVLVVSSSGPDVVLKARGIKVEAQTEFDVRAGTNLSLRAGSSAKLEASASAEVRSGGQMKVSGSTISLNNGSKPVARQNDSIGGPSGGAVIVAGNPTVLA
jgi:hypothetical protein